MQVNGEGVEGQDGEKVAQYARDLLGRREDWIFPGGYRDSLAHSIIDAVYSLRSRYGVVANVRSRYDKARERIGGDPRTDGVDELISAIEAAGGPEAAGAGLFGNLNKAPGTSRLKSVVVYEVANALGGIGIRTADDLRAVARDETALEPAKQAWLSVPGLGPASWSYVLMLVGVDGTKPDVMTRRFVRDAVGADALVPEMRTSAAIEAAAAQLGVNVSVLDHTIWRYQSGRMAGPEDINVE